MLNLEGPAIQNKITHYFCLLEFWDNLNSDIVWLPNILVLKFSHTTLASVCLMDIERSMSVNYLITDVGTKTVT